MTTFRLHQGDAIDLMRSIPSASVDCLDLDCAYESLEKHRAKGTTTRLKKSAASSNEWFELFRNVRFPELFAEAFRVLKKGTHFYFWCDDETAEIAKPIARAAGFTFWNTIIWVKTKGVVNSETMEQSDVSVGLGYHFRRAHENILMFEKGKRKLNDLGIADVLCFPRIRNDYPTAKPVDLHKVLISQSTKLGEVVLDPFMGCGSAGNAAVRLGRSFVGGDIKESAVALARQRLLGAGGHEDPSFLTASEAALQRLGDPEPVGFVALLEKTFAPVEMPVFHGATPDGTPITRTVKELDAALDRALDEEQAERIVAAHQPVPGPLADRTDLPDHERAVSHDAYSMLQAGIAAVKAGDVKPLDMSRLVGRICRHGDITTSCVICKARR